MKHLNKIVIFLFLLSVSLVSCNDLLDVNSDKIVTTDEYQMNASNDSLYSMFGIFSKLEKLADSYVLVGELRGDLMDVTDKSTDELKALSNFSYSSGNTYTSNIKDYYAVINNCNYVIKTVDTTKVKGGVLVLKRVYAAAKAIRAWTYMQIALNYKTASYYEEPILTVSDAENIQNNAPQLTMEQLAPILINDLLPYKDVENLSLGYLYLHKITYSFFPINFLLGDLYLWSGQYENAANEYYNLMYKRGLVISSAFESSHGVVNTSTPVFNSSADIFNWYKIFQTGTTENITNIVASNQYGFVFHLDSINRNNMLKPSVAANNYWNSQIYYYSKQLDTLGDLRKRETYGTYDRINKVYYGDSLLLKYIYLNPAQSSKTEVTNRQVMVYRTALLYLRYAEAVNRLGKPNLAMAVLKNGLSSTTLSDRKVIPAWEIGSTSGSIPTYMNFYDNRFADNIGLRARALGNSQIDTTYIIPKLPTLQDSILNVEDKIITECALETAFEGNRFQDLMRVAIRRNDNSFLADKVMAKHKNGTPVKVDLYNRDNWYIKK
jgi:SusD family.